MRKFLLSLVMGFSVVFAMAQPAAPTITPLNGETLFTIDQEYQFQATAISGSSFGWTVSPETGYEELEFSHMSNVFKVKFTVPGTYVLSCTVYDGQATSEAGTYEVEVTDGTGTPQLTYSVDPISVCADGNYYEVHVAVSGGEAEYGTYRLQVDGPTIYEVSTGGTDLVFFVPLGNSEAGTYDVVFRDPQNEAIATTTMTVTAPPSAPTITVSGVTGGNYMVGESYSFAANGSSVDEYEWIVSSKNSTGYEFVGSALEQTTSIKFTEAGDYTIKVVETSNGCSSESELQITVHDGSSQQITYTAEPATLCTGDYMSYGVSASDVITSELELKIDQQTFTGTSKGDNVCIFDLSGLTTPGTYNATVVDVTNNNTVVATSVITIADGPELPTISSQETTFTAGEQYVFSASSSTSGVSYMWSMMTVPDSQVSPLYEFVDDYYSQSTTIKFNAGGTYIISCHTELNGCSSSEATYNVTVDGGSSSQSAFETIPEYVTYCINGSNWDFRIKATSQLSSNDKFYMEDLDNSHSIMGTVSGNEVIFNISEFAWTEGLYSVKITDSQSNQIGSSNITITSEGPSVLVANWNSTFVVGQPLQFMNERYDESATYVWSIVDTDEQDYTVRTAGQMAYITFSKAGTYTVKCTGYYGSPECSNEDTWGTFTVVEETQQDITYFAEPQSFCYNEDSEGDFEVTASEELDGGSYNLVVNVVNGNSTYATDRTDGDKIYFELSGIPAGTYDVEVWDETNTNLLCSSTLTIVGSDSDFSVQGPETGVLNEAITYTITNPTADMTYTWAVEMYGGDYNSPADEGSYSADSFKGTSFTVTFSEASEDYRITCSNTCGTGTELALNIINPEMYACKDTYSNTYYESLSDALNAIENDYAGITLLKDVEENRYVSASKNLTLDLNGYTATIKSLGARQSLTISNGTFNGMIDGENTNSSSTLQIDNATVNSIPSIAGRTSFFWNAENVSISNNGTLEVQDSAYFGCDEGFSLNIDATSQVVLNGSTLITASTDTTTVLNEIRKYLPDGYTATALDFSWEYGGHSIVLSPDANVTLRPAVRAWFEETELSVMIGDSVQVCLHVEADDPNFDIANCAITFGYGEGEVQFIPDPENPNCTYVKALPGASGSIIGATLVYNGTTYHPSNGVMVQFLERPLELVCPTEPLKFEDGSYELQINEWCDITYHTFAWSSDNESIATVDQLGNVTFVAPGEVTISCTSTYNYDADKKETAYCTLNIEKSVSYWATDTIFCQGQSGRVTITSSKELNLESFGVQDENGNAVSATVSQGSPYAYINYSELQTGVYYITFAGKQVASFHVIANSLPDASFDCPTDAVEGGVWNVTAAKGYYSYFWSSDGISFPDDTNLSQEVTFETAGPVWVALHVEDEFGCASNDTCRFTIAEGPQTYSVDYNGKDEINWCHGAEGGHVAFTVTSNKDIPESLTVNHDWASNVQVTVYGKEASIEFDYPYAGRQEFQLITINDDDNDGINDTTIVVKNVYAYGYGYLQAGINMWNEVDTVVNFAESQEITLEVSCLETLDLCTSCGSGASFSWSYDEESIDGECLEWVNPDTQECNKSKMKFTFSQAGTYTFEAQTHQNGCSSEWTSKTIYVVPFDRSLFSLSPEVDTIEIGDADGIQFTLNYDGEPYSDYTLKSDGDVTIDGTSVYDNEVVGTYEIYAEVNGLRVATARLAVVPVVVNYTVADVEMCQDQEDVVATISADRSIYGRSVTVRDEQDNTYYPEYNDNNDAAFFDVSGLILGSGTYTFRVYDNDEYKTEFNVTVNSLPSAYIECPIDPVVGDTWSPNTAVQEGLSYAWVSDEITSLNGSTVCCPRVTFENAGVAKVIFTATDTQTGCSVSDSCEFEVADKPMECDNTLLSFGTTTEFIPYSVPVDEEISGEETFNLTFAGVANFSGPVQISLVDKFDGSYTTLGTVEFNVAANQAFSVNESMEIVSPTSAKPECVLEFFVPHHSPDFVPTSSLIQICESEFAFSKQSDDLECNGYELTLGGEDAAQLESLYEEVAVGNVFAYQVKGVADFTGTIVLSLEEVNDSFAVADEQTYSVVKGETFNFDGTFTIVNQEIDETMSFGMMIRRDGVDPEEISHLCLSDYSIERQIQSFAISEPKFNMFVGKTKNIVLMGDGEPYTRNYVEWNVIDMTGASANACVSVEDGNVTALSEGQAKIEAKVNGKVVATAMVSVSDFNCNGTIYTVTDDNAYFTVKSTSEIAAGETYRVELEGTTDFDGAVIVTCGDFSSEEPAQATGMGEIAVQAGVPFTYATMLTIQATASSTPNYNFMVALTGENEESRLCATKLEFTKFEPQYKFDESQYELSVNGGKLLVLKNSDGSVYGGDAEWYSSKQSVATVQNGYVTGISEGSTEIQVYVGGSLVATTTVVVYETTWFSIGFDEPGYVFEEVGEEQMICVNISGSFDGEINYEYDASIIELIDSQYGDRCKILKALKPGRSYFRASVMYDGEKREAGAAIEVEASTSDDYTLAFSQSKYEITEGESISACLTIGEGFKQFNPQFNFDQTVISIANPTDGSDCGTITGLLAGHTFVEVIAAAPDGKSYSAQTEVIVNAKYSQDDYKLSFEQETYEVYEGETIETCLIIGRAFEHGFQPTMSYDETIITVNEPTAAQSDNCGSVTGVKEGTSLITLDVEKEGTHYMAKTHIVVLKKNVELPQMAAPVVTTEMVTLCYSKTVVSDNMTSLDEYVEKSSANARLRWYDAAGNALTTAPIIDPKTVGKRIYHVSQIASGYNESEKVALAVNIVYVAAPELNIYEQKVCDNTQTQAFVAKSQNNEICWYEGEGNPVAQNTNTFMPTEAGTYLVRAIDVANGCVSEYATVSYAVGNAVKPEIQYEDKEYALGETVALSVQAVDEELYSVVWKIDGSVYQGTSVAVSFAEEGGYMIPCTIIEKSSGCSSSDTSIVTVKNLAVPVTGISVEPGDMELYTNEKGHFAVSFEPAHATNQRYVVTVADTGVAVVSGATVIPVGAGETTLTVSSAENGEISASVSVKVTEYVAARSISVPKIVTMAVGESTKISASVLPSNASKNKVYFMEKADSSVVKVSADGTVVAKGEGTAVVNSYTEGGLQAATVVYVTSNAEEITSIEVPERVVMKVGDSVSVPVKVTPTSLLIKELEWTIEDNSVASYNDGVLKALKKGETTLSVSYKGITETVTIVVNASSAPSVTTVPQVVMNQDGTATVDLSMYVTDEGGFGNLTVTPSSDDFTVTVEDGKITIRPADASYVGTDTVSVVVTNGEGLSAEVEVPVTVQETEDKAPVVKLHEILLKEGDVVKQIDLSDIAEDDMTDWSGLKFTFSIPRNGANDQQTIMTKIMKKTQLRIVKMLSFEQDSIFVTVSDGVNTTLDTIIVYVGSIPNKAPVIAEIPVQNETDESAFGTIDLTKYVADDYTTPAAITWTTSASENISVTVANGVAGVKVLNEFWRGAEAIKFYAKDEEGAMDSTVVYYVRNVTIKTEPEVSPEQGSEIVAVWEGAPSFDIMAMRTVGVPGDSYVLMASLFGFNGSFEWTIEGAEGVSAGSLMQTVTFAEPGEYDVTLTIMSADGKYEKSLTKEKLLKVVGIDKRAPEICKGQAVTLKATEGMDSYYWTSGDAKESAVVRPGETTTVAVTMKQGLFTFVDSVRVKVSVPVSLMEDSVMCEGTTFDLEAQGDYVSYTWNTGEGTKSIALPDVVATYSVMAVDDMQCVSVDTFNLTKVNGLPAIDLGEDRTPCDGTTVTLDAGAGHEYLWSTGATSQTIDLTSNTETVWARITDANRCVNYDTVVVAFTYPYPEQIGVATFSQTTDHIILAWEKTAGVNTVKYRIERETDVTDNWEQVGDEVKFSEAGIVVDEDVNYKKRAYKYRLVTTDGCGNEAVSEVHRSMISTTTRNDDGTKTLQWCAYEPMGNVTQYLVLRGYDATKMDTVDQVPASNLYEIWNETEPQFVNDENIKYRVVFRLKNVIDENAENTLDGQPVEGYYTKAESGPFSLALSNIAEAENNDAVEDVAFPADVVVYPSIVKDVINVLIASPKDEAFTVEVVNANGQTVKTVETGEVQSTLVQIQASNLTQGVYNVRVKAGDQMKVIKVVK